MQFKKLSKSITFGIVVLEAQACGLPAIISDRGGPKEIIQNNKIGFIVEAGSLAYWIKKIVFVKSMIETYLFRYSIMQEEAR